MTFGEPDEFAIDACHEPSSAEGAGFGRMAITIQGVRLGDLRENHCSLFHAVDRLRELSGSVQDLWDESFDRLSDQEIYSLLDEALYLGEWSGWDRYGRFDFLTNTGEQFDHFKSFIFRRPRGMVHISFSHRSNAAVHTVCSERKFVEVAGAFVRWFDEQVKCVKPPYFPVDPLSFDREIRL